MPDHKWITCSNGDIPPLAVIAGYDSDGDTIYIGRANFEGNLLPAKVVPSKGKAYICHGGSEIEVDTYEVLNGLNYEWIHAANGEVPSAAVKVGRDDTDEILYTGRGYWEGSLCVGKVHPSHGCLYIPYGSAEVKLTEYEVLTQPDCWVDATANSIPENALEGGHDADGDIIYVGRASRDGDLMPAKVIPNKGGAYICWGSKEEKVQSFQVLTGGGFSWRNSENGNVPPGAIAAGKTSDGDTLYVGRATYNGSLSVGKVHPSQGCLYLPFDGQEIKAETYEVLVRT